MVLRYLVVMADLQKILLQLPGSRLLFVLRLPWQKSAQRLHVNVDNRLVHIVHALTSLETDLGVTNQTITKHRYVPYFLLSSLT